MEVAMTLGFDLVTVLAWAFFVWAVMFVKELMK
jgi:hypothetical protein